MSSLDFPRPNPRPVLRPAGQQLRPARPAAAAGPATGAGAIIVTAVVCSVMASVATSLVVTRYWPAVPPATAAPAPTGKNTGRAPGNQANVESAAPSGTVSAPLAAVTNRAIATVQNILATQPNFVSVSNHNGLYSDLNKLTAAAKAIQAKGETPAAFTAYTAAVDQAIKRAGQIASRGSETADSIEAAQQVGDRLTELKNQLP